MTSPSCKAIVSLEGQEASQGIKEMRDWRIDWIEGVMDDR